MPKSPKQPANPDNNKAQSEDSPLEKSTVGIHPENEKSIKLLILQRRLVIVCLTIALTLLSFSLSSYFADILRILGISILISYLFIHVVDFLERGIRSRGAAILLIYVLLFITATVGALLVVPEVLFQISQLVQNTFDHLPDLVQSLIAFLAPFEQRLKAAHINANTLDLLANLAGSLPHPDPAVIVGKMTEITMSTMTWCIYLVSIFILSFYFLLEGHAMTAKIISLCPKDYSQSLEIIAAEIDQSLQSFLKGQVILGFMAGLVMLPIYTALGVEYALLLSVFLAIWEVVPVIGPPIGFLPALISVAIHGASNIPGNRFIEMLILTLIFSIMQQAKDNILAPKYFGSVIGIHPVLIFLALMIGARIDGMTGIVFSLPVACVIYVILKHLPLKSNQDYVKDSHSGIIPGYIQNKIDEEASQEKQD